MLQRQKAIIEFLQSKDWVNSSLYKTEVLGVLKKQDEIAQSSTDQQTAAGILSADEAEYQSKLILMRLHQKHVADNLEREEDTRIFRPLSSHEIFRELWNKAVNTEKHLSQELVWHRRLPVDVTSQFSISNLAKVLLRLKKLFLARSSAIKILVSLQNLKNSLRNSQIPGTEVYQQALHWRSLLVSFQQELKIFGN